MSYMESVCTLAEWQQSAHADSSIHCLTRGQSIGLALTAESSLISLIAVSIVLCRVMMLLVTGLRRYPWRTLRLAEGPMDVYILFVFIFDLIQATGMTLDIKWVKDGKLEESTFCTVQGAILQLGETGVAMTTMAITLHTFCAVWWGRGMRSVRLAYLAAACIWLYVILYVIIGVILHRKANYETPTPYWCWIGSRYVKERITGEYLWFWLTLAFSIIVYVPLYFWSRGNITIDDRRWLAFRIHRSVSTDGQDPDGRKRQSLAMIAYPFVYCVLVLPLSIVRWISFVRGDSTSIPSAATFFAIFIYGLSGFLNVMLFFFTRPNLLVFRPSAPHQEAGLAPQSLDSLTSLTGAIPKD